VDSDGFQLTKEYVLGQGGEQVSELDGSGNWMHTNVYVGGQLLATLDPVAGHSYDHPAVHYQLADWLGTRRMQVSPIGTLEETCQSLPFGDELNCVPTSAATSDDATEHHFTGKERDAESGNDYFGARYFASSMGRFMSPDPSGLTYADPTNPQSLNLYSYALNDPLKFLDPTGMTVCDYGQNDDGSEDIESADNEQECTSSDGTVIEDQQSVSVTASDDGQWWLWGDPVGVMTPVSSGDTSAGSSAPSKSGCKASSGPSSIVTFTATKDLTEVGAAIGSLFGPEGTIIGAVVGSQFGVGGNISYVNSTHSLYIGPTAVFAPLQVGGGGGFSLSYTNVPASQNANAIANGTSYGVAFQPNILFGSVVSKSPGSGPPVVGYQVGTRSPVGFSASHNFCLWNCGC
jgi:RHS repeat-associated protein